MRGAAPQDGPLVLGATPWTGQAYSVGYALPSSGPEACGYPSQGKRRSPAHDRSTNFSQRAGRASVPTPLLRLSPLYLRPYGRTEDREASLTDGHPTDNSFESRAVPGRGKLQEQRPWHSSAGSEGWGREPILDVGAICGKRKRGEAPWVLNKTLQELFKSDNTNPSEGRPELCPSREEK